MTLKKAEDKYERKNGHKMTKIKTPIKNIVRKLRNKHKSNIKIQNELECYRGVVPGHLILHLFMNN